MLKALFITFVITAGSTYYQVYRGYAATPVLTGTVDNSLTNVNTYETPRVPLLAALQSLKNQSAFDPRAAWLMADIETRLCAADREHLFATDMYLRRQRPLACPEPSTNVPDVCDRAATEGAWTTQMEVYRNVLDLRRQSFMAGDVMRQRKSAPTVDQLRCSLYDLTVARARICPCIFGQDTIPAIGACAAQACPLVVKAKVMSDDRGSGGNGEAPIAYIFENTFCNATSSLKVSPCAVDTFLSTPEVLGADMMQMCGTALRAAPVVPAVPALWDAVHRPCLVGVSKGSTTTNLTAAVADNPSPLQKRCHFSTGAYSVDRADFCNGYVQFLPVNDCADTVQFGPDAPRCGQETGCRPCPPDTRARPLTACFQASNGESYIGWQCLPSSLT